MIELYNGDCLDIMPQLENNSFDLIYIDGEIKILII